MQWTLATRLIVLRSELKRAMRACADAQLIATDGRVVTPDDLTELCVRLTDLHRTVLELEHRLKNEPPLAS